MIDRTRDILANISEYDIVIADSSDKDELVLSVVWGDLFPDDNGALLYANALVPTRYAHILKFDDEGKFTCKVKTTYMPEESQFIVRFVELKTDGTVGKYDTDTSEIPDYLPAYSFMLDKMTPSMLLASEIPFIDSDGKLRIQLSRQDNPIFNKCYIYSSSQFDFIVDNSDDQSAKLLTICAPGHHYFHPTTGVGVTDYINSVVSHTDLGGNMVRQFSDNLIPIQSASFDALTGDLRTQFSYETPEELEVDTAKEDLDLSLLQMTSDEFIRKTSLTYNVEEGVTDFGGLKDTVMCYNPANGLFLIRDSDCQLTLLDDSSEVGLLQYDNSVDPSQDGYTTFTAKVRPGTFIAIDTRLDVWRDSPYFTLADNDGNMIYTCPIGGEREQRDNMLPCAIILVNAVIRYSVSNESLAAGHGLFAIDDVSENLKNIVAVVADMATGRLVAITASGSYITDKVMDLLTNRVYVKKIK